MTPNDVALVVVLIALAAMIVIAAYRAGSAPLEAVKPVAPPQPKRPPVELQQSLLDAASADGRRIARMIAATSEDDWEFERTHSHYHGNPKMSVAYKRPYSGRYDYRDGYYRQGVYIGGKDQDMSNAYPVVSDDADVALAKSAVEALKARRDARKAAAAREEARKAEEAAEARKRAFLAAVDKVAQ